MSFLKMFAKVANGVAIIANAAGTLVVLALVFVVNYDVVAREGFDKPFHGAVELVQFSMVLIVFLQLPDVVRVNRLTRSDGFLSIAVRRWPGVASVVDRIINLIACVFMLLIAIAIWPEFVEMLETRDYFGVPGIFTAPIWPLKLVIFLSASLCCFLFALKLFMPDSHMKPRSSDTPATGVSANDGSTNGGSANGGSTRKDAVSAQPESD